jgi:glucose-1-phosphate adenylyltransferase
MSDILLALPVNRSLAVIMGGGAGTRLFPLTKQRAKPAVPLAGKYRLVDIPISNCLNSGIRSIYVLTQFNSMSLHRHINNTYKFDKFTPSFVEILAAQQTPGGSHWYQGTADAVRQNLNYFLECRSITISFWVATSFTGWTTATSCDSTLRHVQT